ENSPSLATVLHAGAARCNAAARTTHPTRRTSHVRLTNPPIEVNTVNLPAAPIHGVRFDPLDSLARDANRIPGDPANWPGWGIRFSLANWATSSGIEIA